MPSLLPGTLPEPIPTQDCCHRMGFLHLKCCHHPWLRDSTASALRGLLLPGTAVLMPCTALPPKPWLQRCLADLTSFPARLRKAPSTVPALYPLETSVHQLPPLPSSAFSLNTEVLHLTNTPSPLPASCPMLLPGLPPSSE